MSILKGSEDLVARAFHTVTLQWGPLVRERYTVEARKVGRSLSSLKGSLDLVTRVINKVTILILIITYNPC